MANEQDAFLRQIDEEVRRERLMRLWDKYGVIAIGSVAAILLLFGGLRLYQSETIKAAKQAGAQFAEASTMIADAKLAKDKKADALSALETMAKSGPSGYALLSNFKLAAYAVREGKPAEAIKHYEAIAATGSADPALRSYAKLQIASLKLDNGSFTDVKNQLNDLLNSEGPWRHSAREILGLAALKSGDFAAARKTFQELLTDPATPQAISQRAHVAMAMVTRAELQAKQPAGGTGGGTKSPNTSTTPDKAEKPKANDGAPAPTNAKTQ